MVSYLEKDQLPYQFEDGVEKLCEVESDLSVADETRFVEKNRRFWQAGEPYLEVEFQVKVVIGPADLRFELCKFPLVPNAYRRADILFRVWRSKDEPGELHQSRMGTVDCTFHGCIAAILACCRAGGQRVGYQRGEIQFLIETIVQWWKWLEQQHSASSTGREW